MVQINRQATRTDMMWRYVRQFIEQTGIYIFFVSLMLYTQISWVKRYNKYDQLEARLLAVFILGILISFGIIELIKKMAVKADKEHEAFLRNISVALSPGILFIFASKNRSFIIIGIALCALMSLYMWVKPFRDFIKSIVYIDKFKNTLIIKDNNAVIAISGIYEKAGLQTMQSFLIDLAKNLHECAEMKVDEVKIDISDIKERDGNELTSIVEPVARYFNLRIRY